MATLNPKSTGNGNTGSGGTGSTPAKQAPTPNTITGIFANQKAPAVNGVAALLNGQVVSFTAPSAAGAPSTTLPSGLTSPVHITGDLTNGVAVANTTAIYYSTGVGVAGAAWYSLPLPKGMTNIVAMCGDLANGLVITDGTNIYSWQFTGTAAQEWTLLAALPTAGQVVADMAGDPTNGLLLVIGGGTGPSSLYWGGMGCSCSWVPVTSAGTSLPQARVQVQMVCGSYANGFVLFGESQLFTLTGMKYTPSTSTTTGNCAASLAKVSGPVPFTITDMAGDATNGLTVRCGTSGLIAFAMSPYASWSVVNAVTPPAPPSTGSTNTGSDADTGAPLAEAA